MDTIQEIAKHLRSTEKMAAAFVSSIQARLGDKATDEIILKAIKTLNPRSIEINKVVSAVNKELARGSRSPRRRRSSTTVISTRSGSAKREPAPVKQRQRRQPSPKAKTTLEQLDDILNNNWSRAEREGFAPQKMDAAEFVRLVHRHSDPRDATRAKILRACHTIDNRDILVSPTAVADLIREES